MRGGRNLFRALDEEWRTSTNTAARRALRRCADGDHLLAELGDPRLARRRCQARDYSGARPSWPRSCAMPLAIPCTDRPAGADGLDPDLDRQLERRPEALRLAQDG